MTAQEILRQLHLGCAWLSAAGFALRGYWMASGNPLLQRRPAKVLPHVVDTVLLGSAVAMLWQLQLNPLHAPWLLAKIVALLLYIGLGMVALRFGRSHGQRVAAWLAALACVAYILTVAYSGNPMGPFALF